MHKTFTSGYDYSKSFLIANYNIDDSLNETEDEATKTSLVYTKHMVGSSAIFREKLIICYIYFSFHTASMEISL